MSQTVSRRDAASAAQSQPLTKVRVVSRGRTTTIHELTISRLIFDFLAFLSVAICWLTLKYFVRPVRRSFLCSDLNLYHPRPKKTVFPVWLLFVCAVAGPAIVMILSELICWFYLCRQKGMQMIYQLRHGRKKLKIHKLLGNLYIFLSTFAFANVVNSFVTNVGKVTVGRFRPHFIPSCFNRFSYRDFCDDPQIWITNYTCIGESSSLFKDKDGAYDIRQSFPSGHSSTAFCGLIFLALYIHKVWNQRNFGLFPYLMEIACFSLAAYIGITRVTDNRHHPTDVLAGAILGTSVAFIAFRYTMKFFKDSSFDEDSSKTGNEQGYLNENDEV